MSGVMYDSKGKPIYCKCGKPAGSAIIGKDAYQAFCTECTPCPKYEAQFIYKDPKTTKKDP